MKKNRSEENIKKWPIDKMDKAMLSYMKKRRLDDEFEALCKTFFEGNNLNSIFRMFWMRGFEDGYRTHRGDPTDKSGLWPDQGEI